MRRTFIRTVSLVAVLLTFSFTILFTGSAHAQAASLNRQAAASCYQTGCVGRDPYTQSNCASFSDVSSGPTLPIKDSAGTNIGWLQLWFSPECQSNWVRAGLNYGYDGLRVSVGSVNSGGNGEYTTECWPANCTSYQYGYSPETVWSNMVDGANTAYAEADTKYGPSTNTYR
jgi:hypothetical protein